MSPRSRNRNTDLPLVDDDQAACRGENPELWYPDLLNAGRRTQRGIELQAKALCNRCPIQRACLQHAIDTGERYGIWGGLTPEERYQLTGRKLPK